MILSDRVRSRASCTKIVVFEIVRHVELFDSYEILLDGVTLSEGALETLSELKIGT